MAQTIRIQIRTHQVWYNLFEFRSGHIKCSIIYSNSDQDTLSVVQSIQIQIRTHQVWYNLFKFRSEHIKCGTTYSNSHQVWYNLLGKSIRTDSYSFVSCHTTHQHAIGLINLSTHSGTMQAHCTVQKDMYCSCMYERFSCVPSKCNIQNVANPLNLQHAHFNSTLCECKTHLYTQPFVCLYYNSRVIRPEFFFF